MELCPVRKRQRGGEWGWLKYPLPHSITLCQMLKCLFFQKFWRSFSLLQHHLTVDSLTLFRIGLFQVLIDIVDLARCPLWKNCQCAIWSVTTMSYIYIPMERLRDVLSGQFFVLFQCDVGNTISSEAIRYQIWSNSHVILKSGDLCNGKHFLSYHNWLFTLWQTEEWISFSKNFCAFQYFTNCVLGICF